MERRAGGGHAGRLLGGDGGGVVVGARRDDTLYLALMNQCANRITATCAVNAKLAGLDAGNCGPETPFSTWDCKVIDQGPYSLGNDLDMMISSSGLVSIAYLEDNYDQYQQHVLFSYQYRPVYLPLITR